MNYSKQGGEWFFFDDIDVRKVEEEKVMSCEAYLLFYMREGEEGIRDNMAVREGREDLFDILSAHSRGLFTLFILSLI